MNQEKREAIQKAKDRLNVMRELHNFHEGLMALPLPRFFSRNEVEIYARKYKALLMKNFWGPGDKYFFLHSLSRNGFLNDFGYNWDDSSSNISVDAVENTPWEFTEIGMSSHHRLPRISKADIAEGKTEKEIKEAEQRLYDNAKSRRDEILKSIEKVLSSHTKPRPGLLRQLFTRKNKFFKFKETVLSQKILKKQQEYAKIREN